MADRKQQPMQFEGSKIDALYSWLSYDLQKMKEDLMKELKYASIQTGAFYNELNKDKNSAAQAMTQEIRFSYKQNQNIYDGLTKMIDGKFAAMEEMLQKALPADNFDYTRIAEETGDKILELISDAKDNQSNVVDSITNSVTEKVVESLPYPEKVDYARVAEIAEAAAASAVEKALNALADKMVTPEVDY